MNEFNHTYALIANGAIENYSVIAELIRKHACVIAVDGGLVHCDRMGIVPDMIIGDLDSVEPELLSKYSTVAIRNFPIDKDETDLELALQSVFTPTVEKITLFGALAKRSDHALSNLHLIRRYPQKVYIETENELIFAFDGPIVIPCHKGQTISFIQLGDPVSGVTSKGLKWEMNNATFNKYFFSISNICLKNPVEITLSCGDLLCCLQKS